MEGNSQHIDSYLFNLISTGDEQAFRQIFNTYNKQLFPFILALVKSDSDAREIMQEVFMKLWIKRDTLPTIENPGGWLRIVASNAAYDHLRKQARYELQLTRVQPDQSPSGDEFWQKMDAKETRSLLNEAVRMLPIRRRQIFQMNKIEGYSRKEIAEKLNISENTVRNQLADAIAFVQDYLTKNNSSLIPLSILLIIFQ